MSKRRMQKYKLPVPSLDHLNRLTDDTGLFQHAKFAIPLRSEGYATDDNARAVIIMAKHYALYHKPESLYLLDKYLAFVLHACDAKGKVKNFMNYDRTWRKNEPTNDAFGRCLWAFGKLLTHPPSEMYIQIAKERIDIALPLIERQSLRGKAYSIIGLAGYLKRFPDADDVKNCILNAADSIALQFQKNISPDWKWFEDKLTYDNAIIPCALFTAGMMLNENKFLNISRKSCDFLLDNTFTKHHFSFVGCKGWFPRGGKKAQFDQQPIEAAATILMLNAAYQATKDKKYLSLRQKAFNWFLGENDLGIPLYDFKTKGCSDGLDAKGISLNQGAESTLSLLLALLTIQEKQRPF